MYTREPAIDSTYSGMSKLGSSVNMSDIYFSEDNIKDKLYNLNANKSPGPDGIHPRVMKELSSNISCYLKDLYNFSYEYCIIPDDWKNSIVSVIHKKGKKDLVENYRPISLTCISCKIMESII